ncbi:MAG: phosphate starvation-inducible protein PhoH [Bacteroidetes bacterium HGW-Bacteroidetes-4]|jgi:phosphate starvation-inducible PhoH-like protein|nr:MAG: phosphate starvation-inducible protein PhoH [Bacteroidetes bacterium HGW-Bacteroidetes-4]
MAEKIVHIEAIDPIALLGVNNSRLEIFKRSFPKIQLISRGHEIKLIGEKVAIHDFEDKLKEVVGFYDRFNRLSDDDLLEILNASAARQNNETVPDDLILFGNGGKPIKALTANQKVLVQQSYQNDLLFALGPAGSGKTYTAIALAVRALRNREVKRIVLSRPAVEAGERLGFLPGDLKEKIDPYLQPLYDALHDMIPAKKLETYIEEGIVQIAPLAFMRGRTLDNAFVILDEAQNTTLLQMKMFLTRMGTNAKFIVTGDITQVDLPKVHDSGLIQALRILEKIEGIAVVELDETDIVRHRLVKAIVKAFERHTH